MSTLLKFYGCPTHGDISSHDCTGRFTEVECNGWKSSTVRLICLQPDTAGLDSFVGKRVCGQTVTVRTVEHTSYYGRAPQSRCNGHCTSGKRRCDCQCEGVCHGRGECICGTEEARRIKELLLSRKHAA